MNKVTIQLSDHGWQRSASGSLRVRGTAFDAGELLQSAEQFETRLAQCNSGADSCGEAIAGLNGFFSVVWVHEGQILAAVDHIRSIPLFYGVKSGDIFIGDDAEWVRKSVGNMEMDPLARDEFSLTGYVTGNATLYPDVKQLQAGELLFIDTRASQPVVIAHRYFRFIHYEPEENAKRDWETGFAEHLDASVQRLLRHAAGRQIVIPLSGGYDSRLIATALCRAGYKNILTFTYGPAGNREADYSRQVAAALGLRWHFVEYSLSRWRQAWTSEERRRYQEIASGWNTIAHVQDWLAVRTMRQESVIDDNAVFVPGHTCFRQNTGMTAKDRSDRKPEIELLIKRILDRHYSRSVGYSGPSRELEIWKKRILECVECHELQSWTDLASAFERWEWQERQVKFICNSVRVYEFFGYDWWLPLWDLDLVRFAQGVPLHLRQGRRWYNEYVRRRYAEQTGIPYSQAPGNAEDGGFLRRQARVLLTAMPASAQSCLRAWHRALSARKARNGYIVSHLPQNEVRRLQREGYRVDDMLIREFLKTYQSELGS